MVVNKNRHKTKYKFQERGKEIFIDRKLDKLNETKKEKMRETFKRDEQSREKNSESNLQKLKYLAFIAKILCKKGYLCPNKNPETLKEGKSTISE